MGALKKEGGHPTIMQMCTLQHSYLGTRKTWQVAISAEDLTHRTVSIRDYTFGIHVTVLKGICKGRFNSVIYQCPRKQTCKSNHLRYACCKERWQKQLPERMFKHS